MVMLPQLTAELLQFPEITFANTLYVPAVGLVQFGAFDQVNSLLLSAVLLHFTVG
jgi:hypothetical protein